MAAQVFLPCHSCYDVPHQQCTIEFNRPGGSRLVCKEARADFADSEWLHVPISALEFESLKVRSSRVFGVSQRTSLKECRRGCERWKDRRFRQLLRAATAHGHACDAVVAAQFNGCRRLPIGLDSIDSIWQSLDDIDGLNKDLILGRKLGYTGKCIIHPSQIDHVHKVFSPTKEDIQWAKRVVSALDESSHNGSINRGAIKLDGKMIDAVHYKQAKRILESIVHI